MSKSVEVIIENKEENLHQLMTNMNKSQKIRFLHNKGFSRSEISKILFIRYQFVRNVLITPIKTI